MTRETLNTVCFDWDGTLCDSGGACLRAFRKSLADFGVEFTDAHYKKVHTPSWYAMYDAFGLPHAHWPAADQRWLYHYRDEAPGLLPGAAAVLDFLSARPLRLGIVTSGTRERVERELTRFGLRDAFPALICCEDVASLKPHPEGLEKAMALLGSSPESSCYVGDTPADVAMGKNARVLTVGILSEYVDPGRWEESAPDILLRSLEELPAALGS